MAIDLNGHVVEEGGSIQAAIEAAGDGELVAIRPGIYTERIDLMGKAITLWGLGGPGAVVIESTGLSGSTVSVSGVHEQRAQLVGLTIRGGSVGTPAPGSNGLVGGGGLYLEESNALVYDCRIEACSAEVGGGVFAVGGSPRFVRCTIEGNHAADDGGGAMLAESAGSFSLCKFIGNTAAGLGGGLYASRGKPLIERSACLGNTAGSAGGGIGWYAGASPMTLRRVALASNESKVGGAAAWVRPGYDNMLLDDVVVCGSGTQPILGEFIESGPYAVFSLCADCDGTGLPDLAEVMAETSSDCNDNLVPDSCDIANGIEDDCNGNGIPDDCEVASGSVPDCNSNGVPDSCDIANGTSEDRNGVLESPYFSVSCIEIGNGIPDECEIGQVVQLSPGPDPGEDHYILVEAICGAGDGVQLELGAGVWWLGWAAYFGEAGMALGSKAVTLRSTAGPEFTVLDARSVDGIGGDVASTVISAIGGDLTDDLRPKIEGFTIRFGSGGRPLPGTGIPTGGGILLIDSDAIIENCIIELNYAGGGAAIAIKGGAPIIRNCIIRNNFSSGHGAGILLIDSDAVIENCVFEDNVAIGRGSAIWAIGGSPTIDGTLIDFNDSASQGGGVAWMGTSVPGGRLLVDDCVIQDNLAVAGGGIWIKPGVSNLHLRDTQLCGNEPEEILGAYVDLGGNGGCGIGCPADLTGDAQVNGADLTVVLSSWGPLGGVADLNGDGVVDGADLTAVLAAWGSCE